MDATVNFGKLFLRNTPSLLSDRYRYVVYSPAAALARTTQHFVALLMASISSATAEELNLPQDSLFALTFSMMEAGNTRSVLPLIESHPDRELGVRLESLRPDIWELRRRIKIQQKIAITDEESLHVVKNYDFNHSAGIMVYDQEDKLVLVISTDGLKVALHDSGRASEFFQHLEELGSRLQTGDRRELGNQLEMLTREAVAAALRRTHSVRAGALFATSRPYPEFKEMEYDTQVSHFYIQTNYVECVVTTSPEYPVFKSVVDNNHHVRGYEVASEIPTDLSEYIVRIAQVLLTR